MELGSQFLQIYVGLVSIKEGLNAFNSNFRGYRLNALRHDSLQRLNVLDPWADERKANDVFHGELRWWNLTNYND